MLARPHAVRALRLGMALLLVCAGSLHAQTSAPQGKTSPFKNVPWLQNGARPMGMGGAFLAIADDVSAIYWNPAGLPYLQRGEVAIEAYANSYSYEAPDFGNIDTGVSYHTYHGSAAGPSLIAFVYPSRLLTFGFAASTVASYKERWRMQGDIRLTDITFRRIDNDVQVDGYQFTATAGKIITRNLSLGMNLHYMLFKVQYEGAQHAVIDLPWKVNSSAGGVGGDFGATYWLNDSWRLGAVAKYNAGAYYDEHFWDDDSHKELRQIPWRVGFGGAYYWSDKLNVGLDVYYVGTSTMADNIEFPANPNSEKGLNADNGVEPHLGAEYYFLFNNGHTLAVRAGTWYEPKKGVVFTPSVKASDPHDPNDIGFINQLANDEELTVFFPDKLVEAQMHFSAGLGYDLGKIGMGEHRFGLDFGADFSPNLTQLFFSFKYRLGGA